MKIILYLIMAFFVFGGFVRFLEARSIFYPDPKLIATPQDINLPYEDVLFKTADGKNLHGWFIKAREESGVVLFFHGNAGNISHRLEKITMLNGIGLNIFIIDYRGYGKSEGTSTEKSMYLDAQAAYDYLVNVRKVPPNQIVAYGASLGGAAAIDLATQRNLSSIIIDSSFSNAADIAKIIYPFIPPFFFKSKFNNIEKVKNLTIPKLFFHSKEDEIIPYALGEKLYMAAGEPKRQIIIQGGHNDAHVHDSSTFMNAINHFLKELKILQ